MSHLSKLFVSLLLFIVAICIFCILSLVGFCWSFFKIFYKKKIGNAIDGLSKYFRTIALSINQTGSVAFGELFNDTLIKDGIAFGNEDKAISEVLGWNQRFFTLTILGSKLAGILDKIDTKHCQKTLFQSVEKSKLKITLFNKLENERNASN